MFDFQYQEPVYPLRCTQSHLTAFIVVKAVTSPNIVAMKLGPSVIIEIRRVGSVITIICRMWPTRLGLVIQPRSGNVILFYCFLISSPLSNYNNLALPIDIDQTELMKKL